MFDWETDDAQIAALEIIMEALPGAGTQTAINRVDDLDMEGRKALIHVLGAQNNRMRERIKLLQNQIKILEERT